MFPIDNSIPGNYSVIAWANDQRIIYYAVFGSYQGEWFLSSKNQENYYFYSGSYGSCSGCDSLEAFGDIATKEQACKFAKDYMPFVIVPRDTMIRVVRDDVLKTILPANQRDYSDVDIDSVSGDLMLAIKLEEQIPIVGQDVLNCHNAEVKQRGLKAFGYDNFVTEFQPVILHKEGDNELIKIDEIIFAHLKDSSTERRYLLRVAPHVKTVHEAVAWTFGMKSEEYQPLQET